MEGQPLPWGMNIHILRNGRRMSSAGFKLPSSRANLKRKRDKEEGGHPFAIGRVEILAAQHLACGCSSSPWSTKNKCPECTSVDDWAVKSLSRRLLHFTLEDKGKIFVSSRGATVRVDVDNKLMKGKGTDWSDPVQVKNNSRITIMSHIQQQEHQIQLEIELPAAQPEKIPGIPVGIGEACQEPSIEVAHSNVCSELPISALQPILFLVPLGHDMSSARRKLLATKAREVNVKVTEDYASASHLVISHQVKSWDEVGRGLSVPGEILREHVERNSVLCVLPKWLLGISSATTPSALFSPSILLQWHCKPTTRKPEAGQSSTRFPRNVEVAAMFQTLSDLHQSSPLLDHDEWKAYRFRVVAGRILNLDFELSNHPAVLKRAGEVKGIGANSVAKIKEFLETNTVERIHAFKTDPDRVAMRNLMAIWGVGKSKARELMGRGLKSISDVRKATHDGCQFLDRNQLVGVDCYEDILEEMPRNEVEAIGKVVSAAVHAIFSEAEVRIMGSYRRQKTFCGDVDIHITHKDFHREIPPEGLSKIVDLLWERGQLIYHLTFLKGMSTGGTVEDYMQSSRHIPEKVWSLSKNAGFGWATSGDKSSSYMGVIQSPIQPTKRRRVDIKFYPYRERAFAALYFTGNGYFNRSMRLWSKTKCGYTLNDHGLFIEGTADRVMEASEEIQIFEKLGLVYKEPNERDCFDAVEGKQGFEVLEISPHQIKEDKKFHWVN
eukprot:Nitzschia sp. Nitz4//NODE_159_length_47236_cov_74.723851//38884//41271//NITZ4_additional_000015-RA//1//CDS//3329531764//280//frame0